MKEIELLQSLVDMAEKLSPSNKNLDAIQRRGRMILGRVFGDSSKYLMELEGIDIYWPSGGIRTDSKEQMLNLFKVMLEEVKEFGMPNLVPQRLLEFPIPQKVDKVQKDNTKVSNSIFIVHGHDEAMKQAVARTLEKPGLEPIILHEKPDKGRTVIEKFMDYSNVSFAVVLLSPDDMAYSKDSSPKDARPRARQNVILELGFFLGKLGRGRVIVLYQEKENFEMPSDYSGVLYKPYDSKGQWQFDLIKELKARGYAVDADKLL